MTGTRPQRPASFGPRRVARVDTGGGVPVAARDDRGGGRGRDRAARGLRLRRQGRRRLAVALRRRRRGRGAGPRRGARTAHDAFHYHLAYGPAVKPVVMV